MMLVALLSDKDVGIVPVGIDVSDFFINVVVAIWTICSFTPLGWIALAIFIIWICSRGTRHA
jgi:hypothetical protein